MRNRQAGFSLVAVMVAAAIGAVIVAAMVQSMGANFRAARSVGQKVDFSFIKQQVLRTSCSATLPAGGCTPGELVELKGAPRRGGTPTLVRATPDNPSRYGEFAVRAECSPGGNGIIVRAARLRPGRTLLDTAESDFAPDPAANMTFTWDDPQSLVTPENYELCAEAGGGGGNGRNQAIPCGTVTNGAMPGSKCAESRTGDYYVLRFRQLLERSAGLQVCCHKGDLAVSMGGNMRGHGGNDSMIRTWHSGGRCISFCEKECNAEIWESVWLSCVAPNP